MQRHTRVRRRWQGRWAGALTATVLTALLAGRALATPRLELSESSIEFGDFFDDPLTVYRWIEVRNLGTSTLHVTRLAITGAPAYFFLGVDPSCDGAQLCPAFAVPAGEVRGFTVNASNQWLGEQQATLQLDSDGGGVSIPIHGVAYDRPAIEFVPSELRFPAVRRCTGSSQLSFAVRNSGPATAAPLFYSFRFPQDRFAISAPQCPQQLCSGWLAAGASQIFDATYTDFCSDTVSSWMPVTTNIPDLSLSIEVTTPNGEGKLELDAAPLEFPVGRVGQPLPPQPLRGRNQSSVPLRLRNVLGLSDAGASVVISGGPAGGELAPGEAATWMVTVTPSVHGPDTVYVYFSTDGMYDPDTRAELFGAGEGLVAEPTKLDFGLVRVGTSALRSFVVRNSGSLPHTLVDLDGAAPSSGLTTTVRGAALPRVLAPGEVATVDVLYAPTLVREDFWSISILAEAPATSWRADVLGRGVSDGAPVPELAVTPTTIDLGRVFVGEARRASEVVPGAITLRNADAAAVQQLTELRLIGDGFTLLPPADLRLLPGDAATLDLELRATAVGPWRATISVFVDHEASPRAVVTVQAQAELPPPPPPRGCAAAGEAGPVAALLWLVALAPRRRRAAGGLSGAARARRRSLRTPRG